MKKTTNIKELATNIVGDGKRPNKYFVTIAYGWHRPKWKTGDEEPELIQVKNSFDSVTLLFTDKQTAIDFFNEVPLHSHITKVTAETIGQVTLEDRLQGTLKEKFLYQNDHGVYRIMNYNY